MHAVAAGALVKHRSLLMLWHNCSARDVTFITLHKHPVLSSMQVKAAFHKHDLSYTSYSQHKQQQLLYIVVGME